MSADIKTSLKEALQYFKQNEYMNVVKKCKSILKKEKNNYTALLLLAGAMQEIEEFKLQAPLVLQRAVEVQPYNPLAWYSLMVFYEKHAENELDLNNLAKACCRLLQLGSSMVSSNFQKFSQIVNKLSELFSQIKDEKILAEIIETLSELRKSSQKDEVKLVDKILAWTLTNHADSMRRCPDLFESVLASVIQDAQVVERQDYYRKYLKTLYDKGKVTLLIQEALKMHDIFSSDTYPLEYICTVYCEKSVQGNIQDFMDTDISWIYDSVLKVNTESQFGLLAKAVHLKNTENVIKAREFVNQAIIAHPKSLYAWLILSDICVRLNCWEDVENSAKQALQFAKNMGEDFIDNIKLKMIEAMSRSHNKQKLEHAAELCEAFFRKQPSTQLRLIRVRIGISLGDSSIHSELDDLESNEDSKIQANILRALYLKHEKRYEQAAIVLDPALEISEAWLLLGEIYWEMDEYNRSLMAFLNGVKLDRFNWECLVHLGRYYREHGNDIERSRRCYQTALQINPNSEQAGVGLSTAFRLLKNQEANVQLLQKLTMQDGGSKWAWLQLGLQHLDQGNAMQAIKAFQHVIRADPNDNHSWESLADAYLARGAYISALKSYQRALELSPGALYPMIQLGNIKLIIGELVEAKREFESILENNPHYVFALKGLGEACQCLAKEYIAKQLFGRAKDHLQQATDSLTNALLERNDLSCVWKLLGDVCYRTASLPDAYCQLHIMPQLMKFDSTEEQILITRKDILLLCTRCYCRALSISQDSALLWHDLACCYFTRIKFDHTVSSEELTSKCIAAAKHAVKLCPTSWIHWNFLGIVCMSPHIKNYALAQHCFVMAIDKEVNNAITWCNLGTLYLHLGNVHKANEAYCYAQKSDPAYMNSWIGQGLIAESVCEKEAMDLLRHCTQLGYHDQLTISYAHHVIRILLNRKAKEDPMYTYMIENMHAVSVATDVLNWYIEHNPHDVYGRNVYSLLLERQGRYRSATEHLRDALKIAENDERDNVCTNLVRVLIRLQQYKEAVEICRTIKKPSFNSQCHLALALFKAEEYEESYAAYETALQWLAETETEKASTLCAMAAMAYIFQGADDAKTLLFQCISIKPPIIPGFLAATALGILHGDLNLTTLVLKELKPHRDHPRYGHHIANLSAYMHLVQNDVTKAVATLSKAVHRHPHDVTYWMRLLRILSETDLHTFEKCAQKALSLSRTIANTDIVRVACTSLFNCISHNSTLSNLRSAQKILFTYPAKGESWAIFTAVVLSRCTDKNSEPNVYWASKLRSIVEKEFHVTKQMTYWLAENQKKVEKVK